MAPRNQPLDLMHCNFLKSHSFYGESDEPERMRDGYDTAQAACGVQHEASADASAALVFVWLCLMRDRCSK
eukprot:m.334740 g.334740  ORF g.334740 m.334740 type:complete len:71 (+) comp55674_c0_seq18:277-489(+)